MSEIKMTPSRLAILKRAFDQDQKRTGGVRSIAVGGRNMPAVEALKDLGFITVAWRIEGGQAGTQTRWAGTVRITDSGSLWMHSYKPPRKPNESPVDYYNRTKAVDDRFMDEFRGRYYCNPAHCMRSWTNKKLRDAHLNWAYEALS